MLKKFATAAVMAGLSAGVLCADIDLCDGQFKITGEYLYLKPNVENTYFVNIPPVGGSGDFPIGDRINNEFGYDSGYRVEGAYIFGCGNKALSASFAAIDAKTSKYVEGSGLSATQSYAQFDDNDFTDYDGSADSRQNFDARWGDISFTQNIFCGPCLNIAVRVGAQAARLKFQQKVTYLSSVYEGDLRFKTRTNGVGPLLGFDIYYPIKSNCLCDGTLGLVFKGSGALLVSRSYNDTYFVRRQLSNNDLSLRVDTKNKKESRVVPALQGRIGLKYDFNVACINTGLEIGYDFSTYLRAIQRTAYPNNYTDKASYNYYDDVDLQGLYVAASVTF